jgi:GMP synthase-like glutamine amidotransferase
MKPRLCFLSILGAPGRYDPDVYRDEPGLDDETVWFEHLLRREDLFGALDYRGVKVALGEPLPDPRDADCFVLGGTYHSVHERLDWQGTVTDWLLLARAAPVPLFGICGGHQMMAEALGGTISTVAGGPMAGSLRIELTAEGEGHPLFAGRDEPPVYHFGNYEHVVTAPDDVRILAWRPEMPHVALDYGAGWYSVQFHPEATAQCLGAAWSPTHPEYASAYRPLPHCGRVVAGFLGLTIGVHAAKETEET